MTPKGMILRLNKLERGEGLTETLLVSEHAWGFVYNVDGYEYAMVRDGSGVVRDVVLPYPSMDPERYQKAERVKSALTGVLSSTSHVYKTTLVSLQAEISKTLDGDVEEMGLYLCEILGLEGWGRP